MSNEEMKYRNDGNICEICNLIKENKVIYKDQNIAILVHPHPVTKGHIIIVPINHKVIMEQLDDNIFASMVIAANRISPLIYEFFHAEGTNIIIRNGVAGGQEVNHFGIEVIPRWTNDSLGIGWTPKPASKEELRSIKEEILSFLFSKEDKIEEVKDQENVKDGKVEDEKVKDKVEERVEDVIEINPPIP